VELRPKRAGEREAVLDLLESAFEGAREIFDAYMRADPAYRPEDCLLALDGTRPVACVQIFTKRVRLGAGEIALGGIGSVGTHPDYQRRGLAQQLMLRSHEAMRERGMPLALLFTGRRTFYEQVGWTWLRMRALSIQRPAALPSPGEGTTIREFAATDLAEVMRLYVAYSGKTAGTTVRDETYWRGQLAYAGNPDESFRVAVRDGRIVAYSRWTTLGPLRQVLEHAREPDAADALAHLTADACPDEGALLLRAPVDAEHESALTASGARIDPVQEPGAMWRVLDGERLARETGVPPADDATLLDQLIAQPPAHSWLADRF